jgi:hypothetical protein
MVFTAIFNTLFCFLKTSAILLFLNDYFKQNFPEKYNEFFIDLSYQVIYIFSKGQIILLKTFNSINKYIDNNSYLKYIKTEIFNKMDVIQNEICQIKSNGEIYLKKIVNTEEIYFDNDNDSIYIYSDNKGRMESNCVNKVILHSQPFIFNYEVSNIKFILFEVKIGDKSFKIDLKTDKYNFYVVNNIIDKRFLLYFLNDYQFCNLYDYHNNEKIHVKIIDQNVNLKEFEISDIQTQYIKIMKDDFIYRL